LKRSGWAFVSSLARLLFRRKLVERQTAGPFSATDAFAHGHQTGAVHGTDGATAKSSARSEYEYGATPDSRQPSQRATLGFLNCRQQRKPTS
jgi:hypothetical protein